MEEELRVLYVEGLATHDGPEPCVDVPRAEVVKSCETKWGLACV